MLRCVRNLRSVGCPALCRCSRMCFMSTPRATKCAPSFFIERNSSSPRSSMDVTSVRSTMRVRPFDSRWPRSHVERSSPIQGPVNWPHNVHRSSVSVPLCVILSIRSAFFGSNRRKRATTLPRAVTDSGQRTSEMRGCYSTRFSAAAAPACADFAALILTGRSSRPLP